MCCLLDRESKQLIITARGNDGLTAFSNVRSGRLEWNMKGELPGMTKSMCAEGVTTDGRGHIFVCDVRNKYIHMFTTAGYKKAIWKGDEQGLGRPLSIRWCDKTSSLNVIHMLYGEYKFSKIRVNTDVTTLPPLEGTQIKREAEEEEAAEEPTPPPAKKGRWDDSTNRERRERESASQFKCKGKNFSKITPEGRWVKSLFTLSVSHCNGCDTAQSIVEAITSCSFSPGPLSYIHLITPASLYDGRLCFHRCVSVKEGGDPITILEYFYWSHVISWGGGYSRDWSQVPSRGLPLSQVVYYPSPR